jgi:hypothetical protein
MPSWLQQRYVIMTIANPLHRRHHAAEVKPGETYRRLLGNCVTETATVLDLRNDPVGIPHVRFRVRFERNATETIETALRLLAVPAFQTAYRDRLA